jgi:nicotinic acid mononucleotide adenylyltransferase
MMGTDNWLGFHQWGDDFGEILDYVSIVIFNRPGLDLAETAQATNLFAAQRANSPDEMKKSGSWFILNNPIFDMSATQARDLLRKNETPTQLAPETLEYIQDYKLYKL